MANRAALLIAATFGGLLPLQAFAQQAWLEEIIVTAQKRMETAQDVPIAITAFSDDILADIGAQNINDLGRFSPGLDANNTSSTQPRYAIRGLKTDDFAIGTDPAVAIYIDGVYVGRAGSSQLNFNDVERVEVLRGPQGTLFGRNAAAGAVHVITKKPHAQTEAYIAATLGDYNKRKLEGVFNTELAPGLYGRVGGLVNKRDGFIDNEWKQEAPSLTGGESKLGQEGNWSVTGSLLWEANEDLELIYRIEYDELDHDAPYAYSLTIPADSSPYGDHRNDSPSFEKRKLVGTSLTINWALNDDLSFISITSFRTFESDNREDEDGTARLNKYFDTHNIEDNDQYSQEFRLSYVGDDDWSWSSGVSYFKEDASQDHLVILSSNAVATFFNGTNNDVDPDDDFFIMSALNSALQSVGQGVSGDLNARAFNDRLADELEFESLAWFGDVTYTLTEQLDLTFGIRYTRDEKHMQRSIVINEFGYSLAFPSYPGALLLEESAILDFIFSPAALPEAYYEPTRTKSWSEWTPRLVIDYRWQQDISFYFSAARGFKAGGYNSTEFDSPAFDEEIVNNFEVGMKSGWLDKRLRINTALFYYQYKNKQDLRFVQANPISFYQLVTGDAAGEGAELEVSWLLNEAVFVGFNAAYVDLQYTDFTLPATNARPALVLDDTPVSDTPRFSANLNLQYTRAMVNAGDLVFRIDTSYSSHRLNSTGRPLSGTEETVDAFYLTNLRIAFRSGAEAWELAYQVSNLFDKDYLFGSGIDTLGGELGSPVVHRGLPRMQSLEAKYRF